MTISETPRRQPSSKSRPTPTGRFVTKREAIAAARTKVIIDKKRGRETAPWIKELAEGDPAA